MHKLVELKVGARFIYANYFLSRYCHYHQAENEIHVMAVLSMFYTACLPTCQGLMIIKFVSRVNFLPAAIDTMLLLSLLLFKLRNYTT